jgi:hypothetical protein
MFIRDSRWGDNGLNDSLVAATAILENDNDDREPSAALRLAHQSIIALDASGEAVVRTLTRLDRSMRRGVASRDRAVRACVAKAVR